jgi:hypothetical protein
MSASKIITYSLTLAAIASPAMAELTQIWVDVPPPAARVETVPPAREGFVWSPGYWSWQNGKHVWTDGRWHFVPGQWTTN